MKTKALLLRKLVFLIIGASLFIPHLVANAAPVLVEIDQGKLVGNQIDNVASFKGIPYATPPVGERRWKAPEPATGWSGTRLATQFSPECMQPPYPEGSMFTRPSAATSEDCLYLNVWTANLSGEPAPVMVWIHGGGLTRGGGGTNIYDGTNLAKKGVVLITINYRLGPFGYYAHPALTEESEHNSSGNYGTLDQIAALQWVKDNIKKFGGDPNNVTVFGESAGSWSVNHVAASPLAKGLLHKGIGQSGAKFGPMPLLNKDANNVASAESLGIEFSKHLGAKSIEAMRNMTAAEIIAGFSTFQRQGFSQPNVDGYVFPDHIANIYRDGKQNNIALILGSNADEGTNLMPPARDKAAALQTFKSFAGAATEELLEVYDFEENYQAATYSVFRDFAFTWNMKEWATAASQQNKNVWLYYFTFVPPAPLEGRLGAYHAAEIRYAFNNQDVTFDGKPATKAEQQLGSDMSNYWVNFAKNGVPSAPGAPKWPAYTEAERQYLEIGSEIKVGDNLLATELEVIDRILAGAWD
jgi:para-nitrobenzyl esterase